MVFGSENRMIERQHKDSMMANAEANDDNMAVNLKNTNVPYDSQVSAMIINVDTRFLPLRFIAKIDRSTGEIIKNDKGEPVGEWVQSGKYGYQEPYGDEALAFVEEIDEKKLINRIGGGMNATYTFSEKHSCPMTNTFNYFVRMRKEQILNTRSTGRPTKLAKSQIVDTSANITRTMVPMKKKGFLGGLFG